MKLTLAFLLALMAAAVSAQHVTTLPNGTTIIRPSTAAEVAAARSSEVIAAAESLAAARTTNALQLDAAIATLNDDLYSLGTNIVTAADITPSLRYWVEQRCSAEITALQQQQEFAPDFAAFKKLQAAINRWNAWLSIILNHAAVVESAAKPSP